MWTEGVLLVLPHPQIKTSIDSGDFAMRAIPAVQKRWFPTDKKKATS